MDNRARPAAAPAAAGGNRVYEEVQPQYRMLPGDSFDTLVVDLRAFKNEQQFTKGNLRIQIDNYGNIQVSGERPLGGNRWSRFQKVFRLPEDCNPSGIRATYDDGVLSVVMPKLAKDQPVPPPAAPAQKPPTATQAAPAPAKERAAAAADAEPKKPVTAAPAAPAPRDDRKRPTKPAADGKRDAQQAAQEKVKQQVTGAPTGDGRAAAETGKNEPEPAEADAGLTPSPPVPAETVPEAEKPRFGTSGLDLGSLRQRPRRLLLNVVVAVLMLVALGFYFIYRQRATPDDQGRPGSLSME